MPPRTLLTAWLLSASVLFAGCVHSINALYEGPEQLADVKDLVGCWKSPVKEEDPMFKAQYLVLATDRGPIPVGFQVLELKQTKQGSLTRFGIFKVGPVELDGQLYLDLAPGKDEKAIAGDVSPFMMAMLGEMHCFMRVSEKTATTVKLDAMHFQKVAKYLLANKDAVPHTFVGRTDKTPETDLKPVLTGTTKELREFLVRHGKADIWEGGKSTWERADAADAERIGKVIEERYPRSPKKP